MDILILLIGLILKILILNSGRFKRIATVGWANVAWDGENTNVQEGANAISAISSTVNINANRR